MFLLLDIEICCWLGSVINKSKILKSGFKIEITYKLVTIKSLGYNTQQKWCLRIDGGIGIFDIVTA